MFRIRRLIATRTAHLRDDSGSPPARGGAHCTETGGGAAEGSAEPSGIPVMACLPGG